MKKILSIILITACLACGCSSASGTEKNTSKSTASEPESIDFFAMDTTIKFSAYGDKKVLKGAKKVLTDLERKYPSQIPEVRYIISIRTVPEPLPAMSLT